MCRHLCKGSTSGAKHSRRPLLTLLTETWSNSCEFWQLHDTIWQPYRAVLLIKTTSLLSLSHILRKKRHHKKAWEISPSITLPMLSFPYNIWKNHTPQSTSSTSASYVPKHSIVPEQALTPQRCWAPQGCLSIKAPLPPAQKPRVLQNTLTICLLPYGAALSFHLFPRRQ